MPVGRGGVRDGALDAFRGLAVVAMIGVNLQGSGAVGFSVLSHSAWNGVTPADLVFPFFLLAAGLALPLSIDGAGTPARVQAGRLVLRCALLFLIGVALNWLVRPSVALSDLRVAGVLQRIAIVALACGMTCIVTRGLRAPLISAALLFGLHGLLLTVTVAGDPAGNLAPGGGLSGWLDRAFLPGRLHRVTYDPEGLLSTLSAIGGGLIGVVVQRHVRASAGTAAVGVLAGWAIGCCLLAAAVSAMLPLNKVLWTPNFALLATGMGLALYAGLRAGWRRLGATGAMAGVAVLGRNALTLYVVHMLAGAALARPAGEGSAGKRLFAALATTGLPPAWASLSQAILVGGVCILVTVALIRRGWTLRV